MKLVRALGALILVITLGSLLVQAVSQGPYYAGTAGGVGWTDASNATGTPDNQCAYRTASGGSLDLTNFGFTIPDAAEIQGITVEVKFANPNTAEGVRVRLLKGSATSPNYHDIYGSVGQTDCATSAFRTVGNSADLWGTSWTAADINAASFGVRISKLGTDNTSYVDAVRITVEYTDVMTVVVESGGALSANVTSAATVESGVVAFIGQTTLRATATRNWRVCAKVSSYGYPIGADDPTANALHIKDYLGNWQPGGSGVIVGQGAPTPATGTTFTVDQRVLLASFGDGKIGSYQFTLDYSIDDQGVPCP